MTLGVASLFACVWLAGCAAEPAEPTALEPALPAVSPTTDDEILVGARRGLEVRWWIAQDADGAVGSALAEFALDDASSDAALRDRWAASGLRLVRVPIERLEEVEAALVAASPRYREWIGWNGSWTEWFRGRKTERGQRVQVAGSARGLERGVLRVLGRGIPLPGRGGARVELAFQSLPDRAARTTRVLSETPPEPQELGVVFRELTLVTEMEPGYALIVTAESPGVTWGGRRADEASEGFAPPPADDEPREVGGAARTFGPSAGTLPSMGEAMMVFPATKESARSLKAVLVLIPRGEGGLRLLGE